ncbi:MAG: hypothetical protein H7Y13_15750, partial [Sphingobacteriaceae bacterium]|nr:hypothetical protein [Sphingobacteriaceae bacterium]
MFRKHVLLRGLVLVFFAFVCQIGYAQNVGINSSGSAPDASAGLDVSFTNKGLLIPRVALTGTTDVATIASPTTSLLVYNTATAGTNPNDVTPGYYYYSGAWIRLNTGTSSVSGWGTSGQGGTVAGTNYVGTSDAVDLVFKTNGFEKMRLPSGASAG